MPACRVNEQWVDTHIEACGHYLGNKPLVLQEYNMPACNEREGYFEFVSVPLDMLWLHGGNLAP
jgi:hypothetical protein